MKSIRGGKMDGFFDDYVYGNQLPTYQLTSSLETSPEGDVVLVFKLPPSRATPQSSRKSR